MKTVKWHTHHKTNGGRRTSFINARNENKPQVTMKQFSYNPCKFSFTILNLKWLYVPQYTKVTIFIRNKMHVWKHLLYLWVILNYKYIHICYETSLLLWDTKCDENFRFTDYDEVVWLYITWSETQNMSRNFNCSTNDKNDRVAQAGISDHHLRKRELVLLLFCQVLQTFVLILKYSTKEHCSFDWMNA